MAAGVPAGGPDAPAPSPRSKDNRGLYGTIWHLLPFGWPGKLIGSLLLIAGAVWLLWFQVFPRVEPYLPFDDVQVGNTTGDPDTVTSNPAPSSPS